jgi:hypothetical protein
LKEASNEAQIEIAKIAAEKEAEYQQSAAKACLLILAAFVVVVVVVVVVVRIWSCPASPFLRCSSPEARIRLPWNWNQRRIRSWPTFGH